LTSTVGTWIFRITVPIVLYQVTGSAIAMSLAYAAVFFPIFIAMPLGGVLADHYDRKKILIIGDGLSCLAVLALAVIVYFISPGTAWLLYPALLVLACITSIYYPCFQAVIPMIVPKDQLPRANALMVSAENIMTAIGPFAGGFFVATLGPTGSALVNAGTFAVSLVLILLLQIAGRAPARSHLNWRDAVAHLAAGAREAMSNDIIRYGTIMFLFVNFAAHLIVGNFIYFLSNDIGLNAFDVGVTMALTGVGAVLGAALAPMLMRRFSSGLLMLAALTINGLVVPTLLLTHDMYGVAASRGISMALQAIIVITMFTLRQRTVPPEFLGRTVAITRAISFAPIPIAAVAGGWLIQLTNSMTPVVILSAAIMLATSLYGWTTPFVAAGRRVAHS
jgi:MFS family permease